jgi:hypothetical protein
VVVRDVPAAAGTVRVRLLRTDLAGVEQDWHDVLLPAGSVFVQAALMDGTALVLCGSLIRAGRSDQDAFIAKVDAQAAVQWTWSTDTPTEEEELLDIKRMTDGRYAACGLVRGGADSDAFLAVVTAAGSEAWATTFGGTKDEKLHALITDAQGLTAVGQVGTDTMGWDGYVLRTDLNGVELWHSAHGGRKDEVACAVVALSATSFAWAGFTDSYGDTTRWGRRFRNIHLMAMSTTGDSLWARTIGDTLIHRSASAIALAGNGDLLLGGKRYISPDGVSLMVRTNATGTVLWQQGYDVLGEEELRYIAPLSGNAGFVACGWGFSVDAGEVLMVRKDAQGQ